MSLAKFVSLLERRQLVFCRADLLSDAHEGATPRALAPKQAYEAYIRTPFGTERMMGNAYTEHERKRLFVNCWHLNEYESETMWKKWLGNEREGVAVQTTFGGLCAAVERHTADRVFIGRINYIDYETEQYPPGNALTRYLYKRVYFKDENELRALVWSPNESKILYPEFAKTVGIDCDLETLIHSISLPPWAQDWHLELIESITRNHKLTSPVTPSRLAAEPLFG